MKFNVISCDPPWGFSDGLKAMKSSTKRSARSHYPTMTIASIKSLDVKSIADPNYSVLALWVPSSMLQNGLDVMSSWGYSFKQTFIWVKTKKNVIDRIASGEIVDMNDSTSIGMGRLFRQSHEIALIGTMGKVYGMLDNKSQRSVCFEYNAQHSSKPETLLDRFDLMFPTNKKLEMFARRPRAGWVSAGLECKSTPGEDIVTSLKRFANDAPFVRTDCNLTENYQAVNMPTCLNGMGCTMCWEKYIDTHKS